MVIKSKVLTINNILILMKSEPEEPAAVGPNQNLICPKRGKGVLQQQQPGMRTPVCGACSSQIR